MSTSLTIPSFSPAWKRVAEHYGAAFRFGRQAVEEAWHCGDALIAAKAETKHGDWLPALKAVGITPDTAERLRLLRRKYSEIPQLAVFDSVTDALKAPFTFELNTGDYEWNTPPAIIEAARQCMGGIDLDPASNATAQELVKADHYFTAEDDGLAQTWNGRVWMNPPYRSELIKRFIEKLIASPGVQQAVVITGPYHDTKYGQVLSGASNCLCQVAGRIKFLKGASERESPPFASVIHGVRVDAGRFHAAFSGMGSVWEKLDDPLCLPHTQA